MKVAITEIGRARPVMMVLRHEPRNRNTISTVSRPPSMMVWRTLSAERSTKSELARRGVVALAHVDMAHDVLAHHDGVVDEQADAQRQRHQRHVVEGEAEGIQGD